MNTYTRYQDTVATYCILDAANSLHNSYNWFTFHVLPRYQSYPSPGHHNSDMTEYQLT